MALKQAPIHEQEICVKCGFCCDGTLFQHAVLKAGEKGKLPKKIEEQYCKEGKDEYFVLPCQYFETKCSIYDKEKADVCGTYRCQLLYDFSKAKISIEDAHAVVKKALEMRDEILNEYETLEGKRKDVFFRQILLDLAKMNSSGKYDQTTKRAYEVFTAKCNIFEALLIKHFRSEKDFKKMMNPHLNDNK